MKERKEKITFLYLFYFYLKKTFCFKNIVLISGLFLLFVPIYFVFKEILVNVFEISDKLILLNKWTVVIVMFNIYISFILNYLYAFLKRTEININDPYKNTIPKVIIIYSIWFIFFMILMIAFAISTSEYKYNENGTRSDSYNRNFGLIIFSGFFSLLLINIGGLLINKNNSYIYLMFIFIMNCCILFWTLEIMSTQKEDGEIFIKIGEIELLLSIILIFANLIKRFFAFKKQKIN